MLAGGRNSRCNSLDYFLSSFFLCVSFYLVRPPPRKPRHLSGGETQSGGR